MIMQGYDIEAAVPFIAAAMTKAGVRAPRGELETFVRRAIDEDFRYMQETGVLDEQGYMGEGEYDEDEAFEVLLERLADGTDDEDALNALAQRLDAYMAAQQDFLERSGLAEA